MLKLFSPVHLININNAYYVPVSVPSKRVTKMSDCVSVTVKFTVYSVEPGM